MKHANVMKIVTLIAGVAMALSSATAHALEAKVSGQVNQMVMWADNGDDGKLFVTDNDSSSTRIRFKGSEKFDWGKIGLTMEMDAQRNASNKLDIPAEGEGVEDGDFEWKDRKFDISFDNRFGKFSIGKGDGAANGTSETDLSETSVIMYCGVGDTAGSINFIDSDTKTKITKVSATRDQFDGLSRNERLRYDTPSFGGFNLAASVANGTAYELAGYWNGDFSGHKIAASLGYVDSQDRGTVGEDQWTQLGLSASYLAPFGLNLTVSYGMRNFQDETKDTRLAAGQTDDATNMYVKLGYKVGIHAFAVEYGVTEDLDLKNDESSNYGLAYVIKPWKSVEFYASGRVYSLDRDNVDLDDITQIMAGTRIKF